MQLNFNGPRGKLTVFGESDNLIDMKITLTEFLRGFRKAREAADRGDTIIVNGENGDYVFERRASTSDHPFVGLEDVFGAVTLVREKASLSEKVRRRLAEKNGHRRRGAA